MTVPEARKACDQQIFTFSRRTLLLACTGIAAAVAAGCQPDALGSPPSPLPDLTRHPTSAPIRPALAALHVHASFSEGPGSMEAQLAQAQHLGYDVLWWTEHDWRMAGHRYHQELTLDQASSNGLEWRPGETSVGEHRFTLDAPTQDGLGATAAVWLKAEASKGERVEHGLVAESDGHLYRTSLQGQTWTVRVHPEQLEAGELGLDMRTSWRPASGGREEGFYRIAYRFGGSEAGLMVRERLAEVQLHAPVGEWSEFTLRPVDDFASAWPDIDGRDASCIEVSLLAKAEGGGSAAGFFGGITIARSGLDGDAPLMTQQSLMERYDPDYPSVRQLQGLEVSQGEPHLCWYGGTPRISPVTQKSSLSMIGGIQEGGGVTSYSHPFGVGSQAADPPPQVSMAVPVLQTLLATGIAACDALEVGYRHRGGATLAIHESLWDALSRRGLFLTGLGVNDDHAGQDWTMSLNNFGSWLWARSTDETDLVAALRSGHVYFGDPTLFSGELDILPQAGGHMGSVVVGPSASSQIQLLAKDLPEESHLELLSMDMSPDAAPVDTASTVTLSIPAAELQEGVVTTSVATASDCLVRTRVRGRSGEVIALSNPVWFITDETTYPVSEHRKL